MRNSQLAYHSNICVVDPPEGGEAYHHPTVEDADDDLPPEVEPDIAQPEDAAQEPVPEETTPKEPEVEGGMNLLHRNFITAN
jgi:hypothetical protein